MMLNTHLVHIVWPSIGYPQALAIGPDRPTQLFVLVGFNGSAIGELGDRIEHIRAELKAVDKRSLLSSIQLTCTDAGLWSDESPPPEGRLSPWIRRQFTGQLRLLFQAGQIDIAQVQQIALYDLHVRFDDIVLSKPSSVYLKPASAGPMRMMVANDIHVSLRWEDIERDIERLWPPRAPHRADALHELLTFSPESVATSTCLLAGYINPNRMFSALIRKANELHDQGELDCLLLNGDLVDFKYTQERSQSTLQFETSEWWLFQRILEGQYPGGERLRVPMYATTGNHDYRLFPYSLQGYGIRHCGVADEQTHEYLRRIGELRAVVYTPGELNSIRVQRKVAHSLDYYYLTINAFDDYAFELSGCLVLVLDSGPDFFTDTRLLFSSEWRSFVKALGYAISMPRANGLTDRQLRFFENVISHKRGRSCLVVATHAPVLNPYPNNSVADRLSLDDGVPSSNAEHAEATADRVHDTTQARLDFNKLDFGTLFGNREKLISLMRRCPGQGVILSGHSHCESEIYIHRVDDLVSFGCHPSGEDLSNTLATHLIQCQTAALGHVNRESLRFGIPGYRILKAGPAGITSIDASSMDEPPFHEYFYDWQKGQSPTGEAFEFQIGHSSTVKEWSHDVAHKIVFWFRTSGLRNKLRRLRRIRLLIPDRTGLIEWVDNRSLNDCPNVIFLIERRSTFVVQLAPRPKNIGITFVFETIKKVDGAYESTRIVRHHMDCH